jgi:signal peptidase I
MEWIVSILIACVLAFVIRQFLFTVVKVEGASMEPTLQNANRLIVWRLAYEPEKDDIIVLHQQNHLPYIKRIIATEGQTVDIDFSKHKVYVDGVEQDEPFISQPTVLQGDVEFPVTVPEDCVFVLGDNRNNSRDSRFSDVGMVAEDDILGKAILRFFPFSSFGILK